MEIVTIIGTISGVIFGSGISGVIFYKYHKRSIAADVAQKETHNAADIVTLYKEIVLEYKELICLIKNCPNRIKFN